MYLYDGVGAYARHYPNDLYNVRQSNKVRSIYANGSLIATAEYNDGETANFGKTTNGSSSGASTLDKKVASSFTPSGSGILESLTARVWVTSDSTLARGFIYSDNGGSPAALLAVTDDKTVSNTSEQEVTFTFSGSNQIAITEGTTYWIGVHWNDPGSSHFNYSRNSTSNMREEGEETFEDGTSDPFGTSTSFNGPIDVYITYDVRSTRYVHTDHLSGTNTVTDDDGTLVQALDYYPFGDTRIRGGTDVSQREFIGEEYDGETGLSYLNARYYGGSRGQFTSQDPVFWEVGITEDGQSVLTNPQLQNSYSYAGNNPVGQKDPTGRYTDKNLTGTISVYGVPVGLTGGQFKNPDGEFFYYLGAAISIKPGPSASYTVSPGVSVYPGWAFGLSAFINNGLGGQLGYAQGAQGKLEFFAEGGIGVPGVALSGFKTFTSEQTKAFVNYLGGPFEYVSTPAVYNQPSVFDTQNGASYRPGSTSISSGGKRNVDVLSQSVLDYAFSPGADLKDDDFAAAVRAINVFNTGG